MANHEADSLGEDVDRTLTKKEEKARCKATKALKKAESQAAAAASQASTATNMDGADNSAVELPIPTERSSRELRRRTGAIASGSAETVKAVKRSRSGKKKCETESRSAATEAPVQASQQTPETEPKTAAAEILDTEIAAMSELPVPAEICLKFFELLPFEDVASCALVCRQFHEIILRNRNKMMKLELDMLVVTVDEKYQTLEICFKYCVDENYTRVEIYKGEIALKCSYQTTPNNNVFHGLRNYLRKKAECVERKDREWMKDHHCIQIRRKIESQEDEIKSILEFVFITFKVNVVGARNEENDGPVHRLSEIVINCFRGINNARGIPVDCRGTPAFCVQLSEVLESPHIEHQIFHLLPSDLLLFDTSKTIKITLTMLDKDSISALVEDWKEGFRTITHLELKNNKKNDAVT